MLLLCVCFQVTSILKSMVSNKLIHKWIFYIVEMNAHCQFVVLVAG